MRHLRLPSSPGARGRGLNLVGSRPDRGLALVVLGLGLFEALLPIALVLLNSVKTTAEINADPLGLPSVIRWDNFANAWSHAALGSNLLHSAYVAGLTVVFVCVTAAPCAWALARRKVRAWRPISFYLMASITVPVQLYLFPLYFLYAKLSLINSIPAVAVIYTAMYSPFAIFLLRTYVLGIPVAIEEAAQIDGAGVWGTFWRIVLPMMRPGLLTVAVIVGLNAWNEFIISVTFLQNESVVTAVVKFYNLTGQYSTDWGEMMAAAIIIVLPIVLLFVTLQRRFIDGMAAGSVKA